MANSISSSFNGQNVSDNRNVNWIFNALLVEIN